MTRFAGLDVATGGATSGLTSGCSRTKPKRDLFLPGFHQFWHPAEVIEVVPIKSNRVRLDRRSDLFDGLRKLMASLVKLRGLDRGLEL